MRYKPTYFVSQAEVCRIFRFSPLILMTVTYRRIIETKYNPTYISAKDWMEEDLLLSPSY